MLRRRRSGLILARNLSLSSDQVMDLIMDSREATGASNGPFYSKVRSQLYG